MVTVVKKRVGRGTYHYLQHTLREGGRPVKKELYLGSRPPKNVEEVKRDFLYGLYREQWHPLLERIKTDHSREARRTPKSAAEKEQEAFAIRFTYDTQRIEGSTLTLRETADLLEKGITPRGKPVRDVKEAESHRDLFHEMLAHRKDLSLQAVLHWHRKLFLATKPDIAGRVRQHQVRIAGSKFVPPFPAEVDPLLREFFRWYGREKVQLHPVELAALAHLRLVTVHPFADGNGRVSRLVMNFVLNRHGYPMLNIPYEDRAGYYRALERAQVKREELIFVRWLVKKYLREHRRFVSERNSKTDKKA